MRLGVRAIVDKDVWDYLVADAVKAGSLGKLLSDYVDHKISIVDTVVDAIKTKVDLNLDEKSSVIDAVVDAIKAKTDPYLDAKVSEAKADLTTLETRLSAARAEYLDLVTKKWNYVASEDLLKSDDAQVEEGTQTYTKKKTITFNPANSNSINTVTLRVKFELWADVANTYSGLGQIYKNGSAYGTERKAPTDGSHQVFTEDLSFAVGDTIELWIKSEIASTAYKCYASNFRICGKTEAIEYLEPTW